ncbi:WGxxGxxG family protein [Paenibacillus koleovorans]|uniref:WGxxGxxG family protein n=1 Tax=Paenibacillus koleovorans TaxID=121608 RepID=UPI0013E39544|nr:WGxxGxxG family protein [Paenibacillus koleovorans]
MIRKSTLLGFIVAAALFLSSLPSAIAQQPERTNSSNGYDMSGLGIHPGSMYPRSLQKKTSADATIDTDSTTTDTLRMNTITPKTLEARSETNWSWLGLLGLLGLAGLFGRGRSDNRDPV